MKYAKAILLSLAVGVLLDIPIGVLIPDRVMNVIYAPALLALRGRVFAAHVIVLHNDEAIRILLVLPKLEVSPLHCDELAAAKARAQCHQEQRVILRANLFCSLEKLPGLRLR